MAELQKIRQEIDTDPLGLGLAAMSNRDVAVALNTPNRPAPANPQAIRDYLMTNSYRGEVLFGRLSVLASVNYPWPDLPLGDADSLMTITFRHVAAAKTLFRLTDADSSRALTNAVISSDVLDPIGPGAQNAQVFGPTDKAAIQALSQNQQSRASELGLGNVREGTVAEARAL